MFKHAIFTKSFVAVFKVNSFNISIHFCDIQCIRRKCNDYLLNQVEKSLFVLRSISQNTCLSKLWLTRPHCLHSSGHVSIQEVPPKMELPARMGWCRGLAPGRVGTGLHRAVLTRCYLLLTSCWQLQRILFTGHGRCQLHGRKMPGSAERDVFNSHLLGKEKTWLSQLGCSNLMLRPLSVDSILSTDGVSAPRSVLPSFWVRSIKCLSSAQPQARHAARLAAVRAWSCKVTLLGVGRRGC